MKKKKSSQGCLTANLSQTSYSMVLQVGEELSLLPPASPEQWDVHLQWFDGGPPAEFFARLRPWQRINHFPNTYEITRKDNLARNLNRLQRACGTEGLKFDIFPRSWILPAELGAFRKYASANKAAGHSKTFIYKPTNGARGVGIGLTRSADTVPVDEPLLVQEYLAKPYLLDGFKFDLRLYVLVASCDPMRVFLHRDGLVRLSTKAYKPPTARNLNQVTMHLTNYSINKHSDGFEQTDDEATGSKRSYRWLLSALAAEGHDTAALERNIADVIIKTLIVGLPYMYQGYDACQRHASPADAMPSGAEAYRRAAAGLATHTPQPSMCFEVLGFDIFLTKKLKPLIIEVNRAPSFTCDSALDTEIKHDVLYSALRLQRMRAADRTRAETRARKKAQSRLFGKGKGAAEADAKAGAGARAGKGKGGRGSGPLTGGDADDNADNNDTDGADASSSNYVRWHETRVVFEDGVRGGYCRIYPSQDVAQMDVYDDLIRRSFQAHAKATGAAGAAAAHAAGAASGKDGRTDGTAQVVRGRAHSPSGLSRPARASPGGRSGAHRPRGLRRSTADSGPPSHSIQLERLLGELSNWVASATNEDEGGGRGDAGNTADLTGRMSVGALARRSSLAQRSSSQLGGAPHHVSTAAGRELAYALNKVDEDDEEENGGRRKASGHDGAGSATCMKVATSVAGTESGNSGVKATVDAASSVSVHSEASSEINPRQQAERETAAVRDGCFPPPPPAPPADAEQHRLLHIGDVRRGWQAMRPLVAQWWLREMDVRERRRLLDDVQARVMSLCSRVWAPQDFGRSRLARLVVTIFERLRFNRGQGIWNCFSLPDDSWPSLEPLVALPATTSQEQLMCVRLVQLCKDALLATFCIRMARARHCTATAGCALGEAAAGVEMCSGSMEKGGVWAAETLSSPRMVARAGSAQKKVVSVKVLHIGI
jgi:tubulin polyglutamylase TTLL7